MHFARTWSLRRLLCGISTPKTIRPFCAMRADGRSLNARGYPEGAVVKAANSTPVVPARSSPSRREDEVGAERLWWSDAWLQKKYDTPKWVLILIFMNFLMWLDHDMMYNPCTVLHELWNLCMIQIWSNMPKRQQGKNMQDALWFVKSFYYSLFISWPMTCWLAALCQCKVFHRGKCARLE